MWKILIVDDDFKVLKGMKKSIPWEKLDAVWVGEASDGRAGLEMFRTLKPDIIITDVYMPVMNGLEMIEQLRAENYHGQLIILSGYADFEYARQALRMQVSDYLSKPITQAQLVAVLEKVIKELEEMEFMKIEQEEIKSKLMMYEPFVKKEWLKSVVTGTYEPSTEEMSIQLPEKEYWLARHHIVIGLEMVSTLRSAELSLADWNLYRFALTNIIEEILEDRWLESELLELHSHHMAIILHIDPETSEEETVQQASELGRFIAECVQSYAKLTIRLGFGGVKRSWRHISDSIEEAFLDLLQQTMLMGKDGLSTEASKGIRPIKFYQELTEAIMYSKEAAANEIVSNYMGQLKDKPFVTPGYLRYLCEELWAIFAYSLHSVDIDLDELFPEKRFTKEVDAMQTPDQLQQWLEEKIHVISSSRRWGENSKHKEAVDFMIDYAHEHYAEEITLEDLSKQLFLSRNYLNKIFKKSVGETYTNYMIRVRMEKAKGLLMEGKYMIYEIADKVGYKNISYFSMIFKKYTGLAPSEIGKK